MKSTGSFCEFSSDRVALNVNVTMLAAEGGELNYCVSADTLLLTSAPSG